MDVAVVLLPKSREWKTNKNGSGHTSLLFGKSMDVDALIKFIFVHDTVNVCYTNPYEKEHLIDETEYESMILFKKNDRNGVLILFKVNFFFLFLCV